MRAEFFAEGDVEMVRISGHHGRDEVVRAVRAEDRLVFLEAYQAFKGTHAQAEASLEAAPKPKRSKK